MPTRPGHPVRGEMDIDAWRAALRQWLVLLFSPVGAASWRVTVTERTPEQYATSKRRDDVRFIRLSKQTVARSRTVPTTA